MNEESRAIIRGVLDEIESAGLTKRERTITSAQAARISVTQREDRVLNFCANNYLGLSSHPAVEDAARAALDTHGYGLSSVRFICGTQDIHLELEKELAEFVGQEACILYTSCFDANGSLRIVPGSAGGPRRDSRSGVCP